MGRNPYQPHCIDRLVENSNTSSRNELEFKSKEEYWFCKIGPIDRSKIPFGGDGPLRMAVENKFIEMFGKQADSCGSGWGLTEEMKTRLDIISYLHLTDSSGEILKEIDAILAKRPMN